jgi:predicted SAM-dependent methyltransferase
VLAGLRSRIRNSYKLSRTLDSFSKVAISIQRRAVLPAKLKQGELNIHFGCGDIAAPRFLNVDARPFQHVDYVTPSPFMSAIPKETASSIYACHVFEHFSYHIQQRVLRRWRELLKPGGNLILSVPDFEKVTSSYAQGKKDFEWMQSVLMGGQEYPGNFHFAVFTAVHLSKLLSAAGFHNIRSWDPSEKDQWPRDWSWDNTVSLNLMADK